MIEETTTPPATADTMARMKTAVGGVPGWLKKGLLTCGVAYVAALLVSFVQLVVAATMSGMPDVMQSLLSGAVQAIPAAHLGTLSASVTVPFFGEVSAAIHLPSLFLLLVEVAVVIGTTWRCSFTLRDRVCMAGTAGAGFAVMMSFIALLIPITPGAALPVPFEASANDLVAILVAAATIFTAAMLRGLPESWRTYMGSVRAVAFPLIVVWEVLALSVIVAIPLLAGSNSTGSLTAILFPGAATAALAAAAGSVISVSGTASGFGVSVPNNTLSLWDGHAPILWVGFLLFLLAVLASAIFSALRQAGPRTMRDTAGFIGAFFIVGIVIQLFGAVTVDVKFALANNVITAGAAAWTFLLFLVWGGIAEVAARSVAPRLIAAFPDLRARAARAAGAIAVSPAAAATSGNEFVEATGFTPARHGWRPLGRKARVGVIAGAVVVVLVGVGVIVGGITRSSVFGPDKAAMEYFSALANGDAEKAVTMLGSNDAGHGLFNNAVYAVATDRPSNAHATKITEQDGQASVEVTYTQGGSNRTATLQLRRTETNFLIADKWTILSADNVGPHTISLSADAELGTITLTSGGTDVGAVSSEGTSLSALPGKYTFNLASAKYFDIPAQDVEVTPDMSRYQKPTVFTGTPTKQLDTDANAAITAFLQKCAASTDTNPKDCPLSTWYAVFAASNITYTLGAIPHASITTGSSNYSATLKAVSDDKLSYQYSYDSKDFTGKTTNTSEDASTKFTASLAVNGDTVIVTSISATYY
ncbi:hypothetical protein [Rathayibacter toxicus]|uniref:hypothetical protein n=1 Tax=Rathayibacter toxicus TaxID=145458 RepID=UPI000CE8612A|nr:hypothetical protein [Rathayibacter toxicus]PPI56081.1 hypothetical protein C5D35_02325 [Rathayibacter toxicus]QOD10123.1 hypothetical protein BSG36_09415 [Rathayibacter toxicus]QWL28802.1 hypothetical protein E2R33_09445 [Rathayibacter toxicus]QWL30888.1 hypothetical protein E2R34_09150 [Rathayibacter toxicus]QWL32986.1 hypothetical protein E2R35_09235 [Rathayibacter toxicus]